MDPRVIIVAAVANNNVIGKDGSIPWRLPADLARFKTLTVDQTVIMGRRTLESLPAEYRPLPNRRNIVLSSTPLNVPNVERFASLEEALAKTESPLAFVIGGRRLYEQALSCAHELHLTLVHDSPDGDAFFPPMQGYGFTKTDSMPFRADDKNPYDYTFTIFRLTARQRSPVFLDNARTPSQWATMERIELDRVCPFCPEHLGVYHHKPIIERGAHWTLTTNQWRYNNTESHFLLIAKKHVERLSDLPNCAWAELGAMVKHVEFVANIRGGGIALRFGDAERNGGTVRHLHVHLVAADVTDRDDPRYEPVRFRVG